MPDLRRLELVTEAVRAVLEEVAASLRICWTAWLTRTGVAGYGRPVHLGKNPARPKTGILAAGGYACQLLTLIQLVYPAPQALGAHAQVVSDLVVSDLGHRLVRRKQQFDAVPLEPRRVPLERSASSYTTWHCFLRDPSGPA
ncbi:hypothetical protein [Streptomyces sp. NPDC048639]|uniref:hypothetical protein n=1 Tax=Streptomyces sp. NPDC048639 TaxID=3365581 RepID=UPI00371E0860